MPAAVGIVFLDDGGLLLNDLQGVEKVTRITELQSKCFERWITSVLAQLQLMAVQRKIFISNMMRNSTPKVMASHSSQLGRIPSSQFGEITAKLRNCIFIRLILDLYFLILSYVALRRDPKQKQLFPQCWNLLHWVQTCVVHYHCPLWNQPGPPRCNRQSRRSVHSTVRRHTGDEPRILRRQFGINSIFDLNSMGWFRLPTLGKLEHGG